MLSHVSDSDHLSKPLDMVGHGVRATSNMGALGQNPVDSCTSGQEPNPLTARTPSLLISEGLPVLQLSPWTLVLYP